MTPTNINMTPTNINFSAKKYAGAVGKEGKKREERHNFVQKLCVHIF